VVCVVIIVIFFFFAVAFVFLLLVFFLVWFLSKEDIGSYRPIRNVWVAVFWKESAHAQWYASPLANAGIPNAGGTVEQQKRPQPQDSRERQQSQ
jgi:hypothetical protein